MKSLGGFILMVAWVGYVQAQPTFEKYYQTPGSYQFDLNELTSQNYLVGLGGVGLIAPDGEVLHAGYYWDGGTVLAMQSVKRYSDNEFFFVTGYHTDTCTATDGTVHQQTQPLIGKMDSLGSVLDLRYYILNEGCQNLCGDLEITADKSVITWGRGNSPMILKADSSLAHVWSKHFDQAGRIQFIKELPNGDLLTGMNLEAAGAVVARMNPNGDLLWCRSYFRPEGTVHDAIIGADGSFVITGYTEVASPQLFMLKLDGGGEVQWCRGYGSEPNKWYSSQWSRIRRGQNDSYAVLATLGQPGSNDFYRPFLMKTDLNGDTLWTRSAGANGYTYETLDLLICSDGGLMYSGTVWGDFWPWSGASYIFKTDSMGHLPCSEEWYPTQLMELFPTDSSFTLTSVDGALSQIVFVQDTIPDSTLIYDGCTITGFVPNIKKPIKHQIRPNPTTGRVTVEFPEPLAAESYYSVYDAMGRLLYQRPLPTGATLEEMDLSRFGRGTYMIKFTDRNGAYHERVVLE